MMRQSVGALFLFLGLLLPGLALPLPVAAEIQGGSTANHTGRAFEHRIQQTLESEGFVTYSHAEWSRMDPPPAPARLLLTNVPYQNIYGRQGRSEFVLVSTSPPLRMRIEAKWSQGPGSHDEKFAYLYLNAVEAMPEDRVLIITGGGVWREGSRQWLSQATREKRYTDETSRHKTIELMNFAQFRAWADQTFK